MERDSVLRAGGHRVHPFRQRPQQDEKPPNDSVPVIERYQQVAAAQHRTFVVPRGTRFIYGCSCGMTQVSPVGMMPGRVSILAQEHILDEAEKLYQLLEGESNNEPG